MRVGGNDDEERFSDFVRSTRGPSRGQCNPSWHWIYRCISRRADSIMLEIVHFTTRVRGNLLLPLLGTPRTPPQPHNIRIDDSQHSHSRVLLHLLGRYTSPEPRSQQLLPDPLPVPIQIDEMCERVLRPVALARCRSSRHISLYIAFEGGSHR